MERVLGYTEEGLIKAVEKANIKKVRKILKSGVDVNCQNENGKTPLQLAVYRISIGYPTYAYPIAELLLNKGANPNLPSLEPLKKRETVLHSIVRHNSPWVSNYCNLMEACVRNGIDLNVVSDTNMTLLHAALDEKFPHLATLEFLLTHGIDIKATSGPPGASLSNTLTPHEIVTYLAYPWPAYTGYGSVLHYSAYYGHEKKIAEFLIQNRSEVNARNDEGHTPLHVAIIEAKDYASTFEPDSHIDIAKSLLENGSDVNVQDKLGRTPLHYTGKKIYDLPITILLEHGANVDLQDNEGWTPLHHAAKRGTGPCVKVLLTKGGANPNIKSNDGRLPIDLAVSPEFKEDSEATYRLAKKYEHVRDLLIQHSSEKPRR